MKNPANQSATLNYRSQNLKEIYQGVLVLLIETDKKRDQILLFYAALVAALITFLSSDSSNDSSLTTLALCALFVIFSVVLGVVIIIFRKWHSFYVKSMIVLSNLMVNQLEPDPDIIQEIWKKNTYYPEKRPFIHRGAEWWTFNAYLIISIIPLVLTTDLFLTYVNIIFSESHLIEPFSLGWVTGFAIVVVSGYISLMHLLYKKYAEEPESKLDANACWVLKLNEVLPKDQPDA